MIRGHNFIGRILHWQYCVKCGLIRMRNKATEKAVHSGCKGDEE